MNHRPRHHHHHDNYRDYSDEVEDKLLEAVLKDSRDDRGEKKFPFKLYCMLCDVEDRGLAHIVSWQQHGRCFLVHNRRDFVNVVLPCWFQCRFASFRRQLNLYGFRRLHEGVDKGSYYHELFLRGKLFLCHRIQRRGRCKVECPVSQPNFYQMVFLPNCTNHQIEERNTGNSPLSEARNGGFCSAFMSSCLEAQAISPQSPPFTNKEQYRNKLSVQFEPPKPLSSNIRLVGQTDNEMKLQPEKSADRVLKAREGTSSECLGSANESMVIGTGVFEFSSTDLSLFSPLQCCSPFDGRLTMQKKSNPCAQSDTPEICTTYETDSLPLLTTYPFYASADKQSVETPANLTIDIHDCHSGHNEAVPTPPSTVQPTILGPSIMHDVDDLLLNISASTNVTAGEGSGSHSYSSEIAIEDGLNSSLFVGGDGVQNSTYNGYSTTMKSFVNNHKCIDTPQDLINDYTNAMATSSKMKLPFLSNHQAPLGFDSFPDDNMTFHNEWGIDRKKESHAVMLKEQK